jgi:hypothetical protein
VKQSFEAMFRLDPIFAETWRFTERRTDDLTLWPNVKAFFRPMTWSELSEGERDEYCRARVEGLSKP